MCVLLLLFLVFFFFNGSFGTRLPEDYFRQRNRKIDIMVTLQMDIKGHRDALMKRIGVLKRTTGLTHEVQDGGTPEECELVYCYGALGRMGDFESSLKELLKLESFDENRFKDLVDSVREVRMATNPKGLVLHDRARQERLNAILKKEAEVGRIQPAKEAEVAFIKKKQEQ